MCCDSFQNGPPVGVCPDCGEPVDADGEAVLAVTIHHVFVKPVVLVHVMVHVKATED